MPDRSFYRKGMLIHGGAVGPDGEFVRPPREDKELMQRYPAFAETIRRSGPSPSEARRLALEASNREVEARLAALKLKAEAFLRKTGRRT